MIRYHLIAKIMGDGKDDGLLFKDIKERNSKLKDDIIHKMIKDAYLEFTPEIKGLIPSNIVVFFNEVNVNYFKFTYSGGSGALISAEKYSPSGYCWESYFPTT